MIDNKQQQTNPLHQVTDTTNVSNNTVTVRIPKPNVQVMVLGLVAFVTLFQTIQLLNISARTSGAPIKVAPAASSGTNSGSGTGSNANLPAMQGGC